MPSVIVTLSSADSEWLPKMGDYDTYILRYVIVDGEHFGKPDEKSFTQDQSVQVKVSRTTQRLWRLIKPNPDLDKVVLQFALDLILRKAQSGSLVRDEEISLCNEAPSQCPYDPSKIKLVFDVPLEFQITRPLGFKHP